MQNLFSGHNKRLLFILITMFLNFAGFSIIIPILPFLVQQYIKTNTNLVAMHVGLLMSSYALCQFFAAPGLGMLSDRFGRRPILLISLFGSVVGYVVMAIGGALGILYLGRIIDGLTGGNISTIFAYVADITKPQERGKYYGMIGAAGGFGFMVGPALGGLFSNISLVAPLYLAAAITLFNIVWGYFVLPESLTAENRIQKFEASHLDPFRQFSHIFQTGILRTLFLVGFLFFIAITSLQGVTSVFIKDVLHWNASGIGFILFIVGLMDIFSQGFLVRKFLPIFGDVTVNIMGVALCIIGYVMVATVAFFPSTAFIYASIIVFVIGDGLFEPTLSSLISNSVDHKMQGRVQGANQGMQSVARVIGPFFGALFYQYGHADPYLANAVLAMIAFGILIMKIPQIRKYHPYE